MVFFVCGDCNETLKRLKVAQHLCRCSCSVITCVDCNKCFYGDDYLQHSTCMSEEERYQGHLYQAPKKKTAADAWSDVVEGCAGDASAPGELRALLPRLAALDNVPRNEKKFKNFVGNSLNLRDAGLVARLWAYLAAKRDAAKAAFDAAAAEQAAAAAPAAAAEAAADEAATTAVDPDKAEKKKKKKEKKEKRKRKAAEDEDEAAAADAEKQRRKQRKKEKKERRALLDAETTDPPGSPVKKAKKAKRAREV